MTALETLQKNNLKTDVPSIKERMRIDVYSQLVPLVPRCYDDGDGSRTEMLEKARDAEIDMLRAADRELLYSLAEIGERTLEISKRTFDPNIKLATHGNEIITEAEGAK